MKKMISLAFATVLVCTMSAVAFAAGSISTVAPSTVTENITVSEGSKEAVVIEQVETLAAQSDVASVYSFEIDAIGDETVGSFTVALPGIVFGDAVAVYHYDGTTWERVDGTVNSDGSVTISGYNGFSPFIVVKIESETTSGSATSPVTGAGNMSAIAMGVMLFAGIAVWGLVRKEQNESNLA